MRGDSLATVCKYLNDYGALTEHWTKRRDENGAVVIPDPEKPQRAEMVLTRTRWTSNALSVFLRKARNAGLREHNDALLYDATW